VEVSIPPHHRTGRLETPSFWEGDWFEDPKRHMLLRSLSPQLPDEFWKGVREAVATSPLEDAFVFVHGYNVSFEDGALRTGQIANDLEFAGAPILYSWPSQGRIEDYRLDENMIWWTASHLEAFLLELKERSGAKRIHLVGHSMGNRALATALDRIARASPEPAFDQVVLAAPDIPAAAFRQDAHRIFGSCRRVTLYASSRDDALLVSRLLNQVARAGEAGDDLVVLDGMDTVDVSAVTGGHSYIGDNGRVLGDLGAVLTKQLPVTERRGLVERASRGFKYWLLERVGG
jgi:esterase/lipase superfamily enzyme